MRFEWDEAKRKTNIRKHGLDFKGARDLFGGYTVTLEDDRVDYDEPRFVTFGVLGGEGPHRNRGCNPCHLAEEGDQE